MGIDRSNIGDASEPITFDVERGAIVRLAEAIGDDQPAYGEGTAAPPTFPTTFNFQLPVPSLRAIDPARFIHGEQEYEFFGSLIGFALFVTGVILRGHRAG